MYKNEINTVARPTWLWMEEGDTGGETTFPEVVENAKQFVAVWDRWQYAGDDGDAQRSPSPAPTPTPTPSPTPSPSPSPKPAPRGSGE